MRSVEKGYMRNTCWPYKASPEQCTNAPKCDDERFYVSSVDTFRTYKGDRVAEIKQELMDFGPMSFCMKTCQPFYAYKSGVFDCPANCGRDCSHAMTILGWGKHISTEYWIITNSWGSRWGDQGTAKIKIQGRCNVKLVEGM